MPRKTKHAGGRPTKYVPEIIDKILNAIAVGAPFTHACNYAGINFDTFNEWRKQYSEFSERVKEAEGKAVIGWLARIEQAAKDGNWTAAAWKLERRYPVEFGKRDNSHVKLEVIDPKKLATDLLDELQERYKLPLEQARSIVLETCGDVLQHDSMQN